MKPLAECANGCGGPPSPPSKVICKTCLDKIGARLARWAAQGFVDDDAASPTSLTSARREEAPRGGAADRGDR